MRSTRAGGDGELEFDEDYEEDDKGYDENWKFDKFEGNDVGVFASAKYDEDDCAHPNFISSGHACARLCNAAWKCPPSRGCATDARGKESPLAILLPEGRGPTNYPGLGVQGTPNC
ncbi:hypothetical protein CDL15_Pgr010740 [Punica granatum]|uniref:PRP1 splicing factor N-terminal domain-containing protein n=1 Tax=Punica granatum TaxID=22663 RepID=A0A218W6T5_PUNGR|nr:hypothetical protein CDL15_Pgr010740 [Punica granatum]PKI58198.1 hypothetical protein CRG98_021420 [Punica granatum]